MTSAASDDSYGDRSWRYRGRNPCAHWHWVRHDPRWRGEDGGGEASGPPWGHGHPIWMPHFVPKPVLILLTVLGFILWWPVGLVLLTVTIGRMLMFCGAHGRFGGWRGGAGWKSWCGSHENSSSGNRAFDEYRAETLRRLEEEQKEFAEFLERLRFAKDKVEFDDFVNERRNRPQTPPEPSAAPQS